MSNMTKAQFDKQLKSIKKNGGKYLDQFVAIVPTGVGLYWNETNQNIQVVNDLIDAASALKGVRVLGLQAYLQEVIPHKAGTRKEGYRFGAKDKELNEEKMKKAYPQFLTDNPDWTTFTDEKPVAPPTWEQIVKGVQSRVNKGHKMGSINTTHLKALKDAIMKIDFTDKAA